MSAAQAKNTNKGKTAESGGCFSYKMLQSLNDNHVLRKGKAACLELLLIGCWYFVSLLEM